ncbi:MAG: phosphoglycerate mutase family protein [Candidatus Thorarchaeota archaeon]
MRFFLIRRGQSKAIIKKIIARHPDTHLIKLGKKQVAALGQELLERGIKFDAVYSSDIVRASETTAIICDKLGENKFIILPLFFWQRHSHPRLIPQEF